MTSSFFFFPLAKKMRRTNPTLAARTEHQQALRRIAQKQAIIADLIGGRLCLVEATARFLQAGGAESAGRGEPIGEDWCRTVIGWAHLALSDRPERADVVSETLEQELQTHLARRGAVCPSS